MTDTIEERITDALREFAAHVLTTTTGRAVNPLLLDRCVEAEVDKAQAMLMVSLDLHSGASYDALCEEVESLEEANGVLAGEVTEADDALNDIRDYMEDVREWLAAFPPEPVIDALPPAPAIPAPPQPIPPPDIPAEPWKRPDLAVVKDFPACSICGDTKCLGHHADPGSDKVES